MRAPVPAVTRRGSRRRGSRGRRPRPARPKISHRLHMNWVTARVRALVPIEVDARGRGGGRNRGRNRASHRLDELLGADVTVIVTVMGRRCPNRRRRRARSRGAVPAAELPARANAATSDARRVCETGMGDGRVHRRARVQSPRGGRRSHPGSGGGGTAEPRPKRRIAVVVVVVTVVTVVAAFVVRHSVLLVLLLLVVVVPPASSRGGNPPAGVFRLFTFFGSIFPRRVPVVDAEPARPGIERGSVQHARRRPGAPVPAPRGRRRGPPRVDCPLEGYLLESAPPSFTNRRRAAASRRRRLLDVASQPPVASDPPAVAVVFRLVGCGARGGRAPARARRRARSRSFGGVPPGPPAGVSVVEFPSSRPRRERLARRRRRRRRRARARIDPAAVVVVQVPRRRRSPSRGSRDSVPSVLLAPGRCSGRCHGELPEG